MICPLPSAREMSAFRADPGTAVNGKETIHGHGVGRRGADDETARGHLSGLGGESDLVASGRHPGAGSAQCAPLAGTLSGRRPAGLVRPPAWAVTAEGAGSGGGARLAPVSRTLPRLERAPLSSLRSARAWRAAVV